MEARREVEQWPAEWSRYAVYSAGTVWDGNRFPDQHVAERLTAWLPVLYVDPPLSLVSPLRDPGVADALRGPRLRLVAPRLARLTPVVLPGMQRKPVRRSTIALLRRALRRATSTIGGRVDVVVAATPLPVFGVCGERRRVFYATDDFVAASEFTSGDARWLRARERQQLEQADVRIAVSDVLAERYCRAGHPTAVVANGVDDVRFAGTDQAPLPDDVDLPGPVAGFVGHLSERIDLALLEAVAATGCSLLLVGPRQLTFDLRRVTDLLERANVQWVGPKPFEALPSYLRRIDVGLVPYVDNDFNRASFPIKTLEYLAAGRPVVATPLPAIRAIGSSFVTTATGPADFAAAVTRALHRPRDPGLVDGCRLVAAAHSWDRRVEQFAELIPVER